MKKIFIIIIIIFSVVMYSCSSHTSATNSTSKTDTTLLNNASTTSANSNSSSNATDASASALMDTNKLKGDLNDLVNEMASGKPDTTKMKNAGADILSTDAAVLSDSGIDKMYGNSNDPSVTAAKNMLKNMRDKIGITPDKLDSIKKAAAELKQSSSH